MTRSGFGILKDGGGDDDGLAEEGVSSGPDGDPSSGRGSETARGQVCVGGAVVLGGRDN